MREKKELNVRIGEEARKARERAALTQEQLAERIGVSTQYISDMERGVVGLSLATLKKLCVALQVSSDRLLFGEAREPTAVFSERCKKLSPEQLKLLHTVIDSFLAAISRSNL